MQYGPNWCKSPCHEVAPDFSQRTHLVHPHCTLNTCFGVFCTIWMYLEPFGCLTKLSTKRAELVQKFVPQSRVGIFCNECSRSTPLNHKLPFWCVSYYLGAFGTVWLPYETRCKTGRTSAKVRARSRVGIFRNEGTRSTPLDPKLKFWCVLFYLGALRTVWLPYETRCKTGRTSAKVRADKVVSEFFAAIAPDPTNWTLN